MYSTTLHSLPRNHTLCKWLALIFFLSGILSRVCAVSASANQTEAESSEDGFVLLPVIAYMPETRLTGGVLFNYYKRHFTGTRSEQVSTVMPAFVYTQNDQVSFELSADLYFDRGRYRLQGYLSYRQFPDKFYGIGNDTDRDNEESYTPRIFSTDLSVQKRILSQTYAGIRFSFEEHELVEVEPSGLLQHGDIPGSAGGRTVGVGLTLFRDSRDHAFYPSSGGILDIILEEYDSHIGSDYKYTHFTVDVRRYYRIFHAQILALQGYADFISGRAPFDKLALLGKTGDCNLLRGFYQGRFREKNLAVLQGEYRFPVWWRFGMAFFCGVGQVSGELDAFSPENLHYSYGSGLRFCVSKKEKLNIRLDFGFGHNTSGIYLSIGEAI